MPYDWPGNVRELEHVVERLGATSPIAEAVCIGTDLYEAKTPVYDLRRA